MQRATIVYKVGSWDACLETDQVIANFDDRYRRRILFSTEAGDEVLLDLLQATRLRDGDGLGTDKGCIIRIVAQAEALMEFHAHSSTEIMRIAWHLGNRHLPMQIIDDRIRIRADHVIGDMVRRLGGHSEAISAPFDPEAGAYSDGHSHTHDD